MEFLDLFKAPAGWNRSPFQFAACELCLILLMQHNTPCCVGYFHLRLNEQEVWNVEINKMCVCVYVCVCVCERERERERQREREREREREKERERERQTDRHREKEREVNQNIQRKCLTAGLKKQ